MTRVMLMIWVTIMTCMLPMNIFLCTKVMGRPKHPTRWFSTASRNPSPIRRENGQMNFLNVWAYHETKQRVTGETHFSLAIGSKEIIHPNVIVPSISTLLPSIEQNRKEMDINLDLAKEEQEKVITCIATYQQQLLTSYNKRAKIW